MQSSLTYSTLVLSVLVLVFAQSPSASAHTFILEPQEGIPTNFTGNGVQKMQDGTIYKGDFQNGLRHGKGIMVFSNGAVYEGEFQYGLRSGFGIYTYETGHVYQGQFENNHPNGAGRMTNPVGDVFIGKFWNGVPHGTIEIVYHTGVIYKGSYAGGKRKGTGELILAPGVSLVGEWKKNRLDGKAVLRIEDQENITVFCKKGILEGPFTFLRKEGTLQADATELAALMGQDQQSALQQNIGWIHFALACEASILDQEAEAIRGFHLAQQLNQNPQLTEAVNRHLSFLEQAIHLAATE